VTFGGALDKSLDARNFANEVRKKSDWLAWWSKSNVAGVFAAADSGRNKKEEKIH
jgi:hypothetical protein